MRRFFALAADVILLGGLFVQESQSPGTYTVTWDGRDDNGLNVHAGGFFKRFRAGGRERTQDQHAEVRRVA